MQPGTFKPASLELVTALAGCLLVASIGQLLIVMLGEIDLSVPAYMTLAAALNVHYDKQDGARRPRSSWPSSCVPPSAP